MLDKKNADVAVYVAAMIALGVWQLLDWHYGAEDPIWHIMFYLLFMPLASFGFGVVSATRRKPWLAPLIAGLTVVFVYVLMANGGISLDAAAFPEGAELSGPSVIAASVGALIGWLANR